MSSSADTPEKESDYKPGPAGREYLEEVERLKKKLERPVRYQNPKQRKKQTKNLQPKINKCFQQAKNEDGYPLKHCRYEPAEDRMVYRPPGYAEDYRGERFHCTDCHLNPCVVFLHDKEFKKLENSLDRQNTAAAKVAAECEKFFTRRHCKYMKKRYSKKVVVPQCICDYTKIVLEQSQMVEKWLENNDSEEEEDEENEFQNDKVRENRKGEETGEGSEMEEKADSSSAANVEEDNTYSENRESGNFQHDREDLFVPGWLLTQLFDGDSSSDEESEEAQGAFLRGTYMPKSLVRDRDIGDAPLEHVIDAHKRRVSRQQSVETRPAKTRPDGAKNRQTCLGKACGKKEQRAPKRKRFSIDLFSGLESDSSDDEAEMARISAKFKDICERYSI